MVFRIFYNYTLKREGVFSKIENYIKLIFYVIKGRRYSVVYGIIYGFSADKPVYQAGLLFIESAKIIFAIKALLYE